MACDDGEKIYTLAAVRMSVVTLRGTLLFPFYCYKAFAPMGQGNRDCEIDYCCLADADENEAPIDVPIIGYRTESCVSFV